ncbi:hypothetical protein, partial [Enterobacter cloacae complex sp. P13B]|uniref:hypothetical protein n=1 Tax=Enterobacter cloacae complex sp. P13B TaxID=2779581 RepID=UPI001D01C693
ACTAVNISNSRCMSGILFLSCLYGSEPVSIIVWSSESFLSCLYGSEPAKSRGKFATGFSKLPVRQ